MTITSLDWSHQPPPIDQDDYHAYDKKLLDWQNNGFVVFEKAIPYELIDSLIDELAYIKKHPKKFRNLTVEHKGKHYSINEISKELLNDKGLKYNSLIAYSLNAAKISANEIIAGFLRRVFLENVVALQSLTFEKGSQQSIHVDFPYVRTQTNISHLAASWVALEDISEDAGPLEYYPGSHKLEVIDFFDFGNGSILLEEDSVKDPWQLSEYLQKSVETAKIDPISFFPKKGDVLIWHGRLIHAGTKVNNDSLTRMSHVTHYTSFSAFPKTHMTKSAFIDKSYYENNGAYVFQPPWLKPIK